MNNKSDKGKEKLTNDKETKIIEEYDDRDIHGQHHNTENRSSNKEILSSSKSSVRTKSIDSSSDNSEPEVEDKHHSRRPSVAPIPIPLKKKQSESSSLSLMTDHSLTSPMNTSGRLGYIRSIQRRGNTYMIREELPFDDDPIQNDGADRMIEDLYNETIKMSVDSVRKAKFFKVLYIFATIIFIVGGAAVGTLSVQEFETEITRYAVATIGFIIAAVQSAMIAFSIEKRGVLLKDISIKLRKMSRDLRSLRNSDLKSKEKIKQLEEYYAEVDDYDLNMFDNSVISNIKKPKQEYENLRIDSDRPSTEPVQRTFSKLSDKPKDTVLNIKE